MAEIDLEKAESADPVEAMPIENMQADARPQAGMERIEDHECWPLLSQMTNTATAGLPLKGFSVGDLLRLKPGQIIESAWAHTEDVPLKVGHVQAAWTEF